MSSSRSIMFGVVFCLAVTTAAVGADNILSLVPENSLGFAMVRQIGELDTKVGKVAELMTLPISSGRWIITR